MDLSLDNVFGLLRDNLSGWYVDAVKAGMFLYGLPLIVLTIMSFLLTPSEEVVDALSSLSEYVVLLWPLFAIFLVVLLLDSFLKAGILRSLVTYKEPGHSVGFIARLGSKNLLRFVGFELFTLLMLLIINLVVFAPVIFSGLSGAGLQAIAFLILGFFVVLAVYAFLIPRFCLAPIIFFKQRGVLNAYKQSYSMTRGKFWVMFGYLALLLLATIILYYALAPITLAISLVGFSGTALVATILEVVLRLFIAIFWVPLVFAYLKSLHDAFSTPVKPVSEEQPATVS